MKMNMLAGMARSQISGTGQERHCGGAVHAQFNEFTTRFFRRLLAACPLLMTLLMALLLVMMTGAALAQSIEAEGTAPIQGPVGVAKRLAIQDAIRQALFQANAQVSTTTVQTANGVVTDNVRFTARGNVTNVVVIDEWTDETNYYVRIRAHVPSAPTVSPSHMVPRPGVAPTSIQSTPQAMAPTRTVPTGPVSEMAGPKVESMPMTEAMTPMDVQAMDAAAHYRRKLAVTQFHVLDRTQITDLPNIEVELAREIKRRLDQTGRVRTVEASQYLVPLSGDDLVSQNRILGALPPAREPGQLAIEFAESLGVQFVVSGLIRDMSVTKHALGSRVRHLELDLAVHDGVTGAEVARHRISEDVDTGSGLFESPTSTPVLDEKFYASPFGRRVSRALDQLVTLLVGDMTVQPFTARVIRAEGNKVFFDAGGSANVQVGDVLNTYQLAPSSMTDLPGQRQLGFEEKATTTLVVTQVQRLFSVGELDSDTARMAQGDIIRFDP